MKLAIVIGMALLATACASTGEVDGHRIRGTAAPPVEQATVANDLHAGAPAWLKDGWRQYLDHADGRYAVLAMDKNARGWGYIYCPAAGDCNSTISFRRLNEQKALENCRETVRANYPAFRPDCAIYAIKDKIVWQGKFPWE